VLEKTGERPGCHQTTYAGTDHDGLPADHSIRLLPSDIHQSPEGFADRIAALNGLGNGTSAFVRPPRADPRTAGGIFGRANGFLRHGIGPAG